MQPREKSLRIGLERTATDAQTIAKTVAKVVLDHLGVGDTAPWYSLEPQYDGKDSDRINDHHMSLAEKHAAEENSNCSY